MLHLSAKLSACDARLQLTRLPSSSKNQPAYPSLDRPYVTVLKNMAFLLVGNLLPVNRYSGKTRSRQEFKGEN